METFDCRPPKICILYFKFYILYFFEYDKKIGWRLRVPDNRCKLSGSQFELHTHAYVYK